MVHASGNCFAQHGHGGIRIARRSPHSGTGELHRTVTDAAHGH
jgi:hypothetical protein